jgi:uncharacterized iron-regulated membrane protein
MVLGILLYAVVITGTVAVFGHEIAEWSAGGARNHAPLSSNIDGKVRPALDRLSKGYLDEVSIWADARGDLVVFAHAHVPDPETGAMEEYGPMFRINSETGEILERNEGFAFDRPDWHSASALETFLVDLHVQLYMPQPWGLIVTGILGLSMMVAAITGFLMHRHLIRDLFVAARPGERLVSARDRHVLAASWGLLFAFLLGFTGSFYSFAGTVTFPMLAQVAFGGDREALVHTLFEAPVTPDARPVRFADLDKIVAKAQRQTGGEVSLIKISHYGRADARVSVWHLPPERGLGYVHNSFDGADGRFLGTRPIVGNKPSAGSAIYSLMAPLHFGHFAGVLSKAVWVGLGAAMCYVILSGMRLWCRRREDERLWRGFDQAVTVTGWGLPVAMIASAYAFFISSAIADPFDWTPWGFVLGAVLSVAIGLGLRDGEATRLWFRRLVALGCLGLPAFRLICVGPDWARAVMDGQGAVISLDLAFAFAGLVLLYRGRATRARQPAVEPAE